ncbi:transposase [Escherichia coli]|nr:transposase [Escherichia coli]EHX8709931.1 transposase [Escherichia coli]EIP6825670.1 transposase [Escherichia coli]HCB7517897.1 transposase [Escherichia coli]HEA8674745.1 transposase [Escherichia coli]
MSSFVEQVKELRAISIQAHEMKESRCADKELRKARIRLRKLEKELLRKDKAQAEAAVLLMLREKFNVLWNTVGKSDISS